MTDLERDAYEDAAFENRFGASRCGENRSCTLRCKCNSASEEPCAYCQSCMDEDLEEEVV